MIEVKTALNAVEDDTTSDPISIEGAKKVTFLFTRTNHSSGNAVYSVEASVDGITYVTCNKLIDNLTNSNTQNVTRVASKTLSSNTSAVLSLDLRDDAFRYVKVEADITTDGKATAKVLIER
jgi:hypothetical protein